MEKYQLQFDFFIKIRIKNIFCVNKLSYLFLYSPDFKFCQPKLPDSTLWVENLPGR